MMQTRSCWHSGSPAHVQYASLQAPANAHCEQSSKSGAHVAPPAPPWPPAPPAPPVPVAVVALDELCAVAPPAPPVPAVAAPLWAVVAAVCVPEPSSLPQDAAPSSPEADATSASASPEASLMRAVSP